MASTDRGSDESLSITEGNRMPFEKGKSKTGGRAVGVPNKFTGTFREAVRTVYDGLGGHAAFLEWAKNNSTEYYRIASRLIPGEMQENKEPIRVVIYGKDGSVSPVEMPSMNQQALLEHSTDDGADRAY